VRSHYNCSQGIIYIYKLDLVDVQEIEGGRGKFGTVRAGDYIFSMEKEKFII
jgi:hypothetical protein